MAMNLIVQSLPNWQLIFIKESKTAADTFKSLRKLYGNDQMVKKVTLNKKFSVQD